MADPNVLTNKSQIIINFCKHTKRLIYLATNIMPNNIELRIIKRGVDRVISSIGNVLIEEVGPELWLYQHQISVGDFSFVECVDFNNHIDKRKHLVSDKTNANKYKSIVNTILSSYQGCSEEEKKDIHNIVKKMLKEYVKYLIHCKTYKDT